MTRSYPLELAELKDLLSKVSVSGAARSDELGRYVVLHGYFPEIFREEVDDDHPFMANIERYAFQRVGDAASVEEALRTLSEKMEATYASLNLDLPAGTWATKLDQWLEGAWDSVSSQTEGATNFAVSHAKRLFPASRFVAGMFTGAPYEGEAACLLELAPSGAPTGEDARLFAAIAAASLERAQQALSRGATVAARDEHGNTPLHHAVARHATPIVQALLRAGADPNAGAEFTNAPATAALNESGAVGPFLRTIDAERFAIVMMLVEHGADLRRTMGPDNGTLLDLLVQTRPFDAERARALAARGCSSALMFPDPEALYQRPLDNVLSLPFGDPEECALVADRVRILGLLGCNPNERGASGLERETPVERFLTTGYDAEEVAPEVIVDIARALVEIGMRNQAGEDGRSPRDRAHGWASHQESMKHYAEAAKLFEDAS